MEIALVLLILAVAMLFFVTERYPADLVALLVLVALLLLGLVTPQEAVSGFSHPATITIASMFVFSAGLQRTGAIRILGQIFVSLGRRRFLLLAILMLTVGGASAFINNTAAVAVFLPLVLTTARRRKVPPSKLLIPLSFASQLGGVCTLIGTSTNLVVSGIAQDHGLPAFSMFEMTPVGLLLFGTGVIYLLLIGQWFLPGRRGAELLDSYSLRNYLAEFVVKKGSPLIGRAATELSLTKTRNVTLVEIFRDKRKIWFPLYEPIREGDVLLLRGKIDRLLDFQRKEKLAPWAEFKLTHDELLGGDRKLVEALVAPGSQCIGQTLAELQFRQRFNTVVLGIQRHGQLLADKLASVPLQLGDAVLMLGRPADLDRLRATGDFVLLGEVDRIDLAHQKRAWRAIAIVAGAVGLAAAHVLPIMICAILGAVLLVLTHCLEVQEAYEAIDWQVIFLLAGVLPLGVAMDRSGAAVELATWTLQAVGSLGPVGILGALYVLTAFLTACMSNTACAALMAPIAITTAHQTGMDPKPLLMAVMFAASTCFVTPVGYQTNLMVYNAGNYRFSDFVKVGLPLNILFAVVAIYFIPLFWPL
jgi:di/tricarboxylate transporter